MKRIFGHKRIAVLVTAVAMLVVAASAYAAVNTYTATLSFKGKAGTAKKPVANNFIQRIDVTPATAGDRAGILLNIKTTIYGLKADGKDFPTCTIAKITAAKSDTGCPKGALVATGAINALLGKASDFSTSGTEGSCDPMLDVWNGGQGKLAFFFVDSASHLCLNGAISTGTVAPYPGTEKLVGKNLVVNVPIPKSVDYPVSGLAGSLQTEMLSFKSHTSGKHISIASVACQSGKRPYSTALTATLPGQSPETITIKGSGSCS